jgi:uncharacterized protein
MRRTLQLAAVGSAAGLYSGLFGVGGGVVIVPLVILWLGYGAREAVGTSLAAIVIIAALTAAMHGAYGNVHVGRGLLIGLPATVGVVAGAWLQQRVSPRWITLAFAGFLAFVGVELLR